MSDGFEQGGLYGTIAKIGGVIDAHLHFVEKDPYFDEIARKAGHVNTGEHLDAQYRQLKIRRGIVMGNRSLALKDHIYPDFLSYCVGLDNSFTSRYLSCPSADRPRFLRESADMAELHLRRKNCVGVKLYPGYSPIYVTDPCFEPFYELAAYYRKPVAVHTGETAGPGAVLRYSHPLTIDEAAAKHPAVRFVMCHFGNPWLSDAAAVMSKNPNVAADLSGLLEGRVEIHQLFEEQKGYMDALRTWLGYFGYRDVMFGTDWPLANLADYIEFVRRLVPEKYWDDIFYQNACRIYGLQ